MRICLFYQCDTKSTTENKNKKVFIFSFPRTYKKGNIFVWIKIWISKWFVCEVICLIVIKWLKRNKLCCLFMKIIKETQHIKHQSMIVFPCVKSFFYLFVCLFVFAKEIFEVNIFSVKYASFAFRKVRFRVCERICLFNEERKISMKRCDFPLKTSSFLNEICFVLWWTKHFSLSENERMNYKCIRAMNLERKVYSSFTRKGKNVSIVFLPRSFLLLKRKKSNVNE